MNCSCLLTTQKMLRLLLAGIFISYSFLRLSASLIRYSYQLLVTGGRCYSLLYQLLLAVSAAFINSHFRYYFQVLLSGNFITYPYELFASTIPIWYFCSDKLTFISETLKGNFLWLLLTPIMYPYFPSERGNNQIRLQVKFTAFTSLRKRKQYIYSEI